MYMPTPPPALLVAIARNAGGSKATGHMGCAPAMDMKPHTLAAQHDMYRLVGVVVHKVRWRARARASHQAP
jgi:hypothetical protein